MSLAISDKRMLEAFLAIEDFGLVIVDEEFNIVKFGKGAERLFGYSASEVEGKHVNIIIPMEFHSIHNKYMSTFATGDISKTLMRRNRYIPVVTKNKSTFKTELTVSKHQFDEGRVYSVLIKDVTQKVELESEVKLSQSRLKSAIKADGLTIFEIDYAGHTITYFGALEEIFKGVETPEQFKETIYKHLSKENAIMTQNVFNRHIENNEPINFEVEFINADNNPLWLNVNAEMLFDEKGDKFKFIGALKNITNIKNHQKLLQEEMEKAKVAGHAKSRLLAAVSHEMRTPLNGIFGNLQILENSSETAENGNNQLGLIKQSANSLLNVINEILEISNIENGEIIHQNSEICIDTLTCSIVKDFQSCCDAKDVSLEVYNNCQINNVKADVDRIKVILHNVMQNAVKYTNKGKVEIYFNIKDNNLEITIKDSGIGIKHDKLDIINNAFASGDDYLPEEFAGSGIGLIASYRIAKALGGDFTIQSEYNKGTIVTFSFPVTLLNELSDKEGRNELYNRELYNNETNDLGEITALIAEDNEVNQVVLKAFLSAINVDSVIVNNGLEAVDAFKSRQFDLVLMDIKMPEMDGRDATKIIRNYEDQRDMAHTPIIAVTANALPQQIEDYVNCGMDAVVVKPINAPNLYKAIDEAMANSEDNELEVPDNITEALSNG